MFFRSKSKALRLSASPPGAPGQVDAMHRSQRGPSFSVLRSISEEPLDDEYLYRCMRGDGADLLPGAHTHVYVCECRYS